MKPKPPPSLRDSRADEAPVSLFEVVASRCQDGDLRRTLMGGSEGKGDWAGFAAFALGAGVVAQLAGGVAGGLLGEHLILGFLWTQWAWALAGLHDKFLGGGLAALRHRFRGNLARLAPLAAAHLVAWTVLRTSGAGALATGLGVALSLLFPLVAGYRVFAAEGVAASLRSGIGEAGRILFTWPVEIARDLRLLYRRGGLGAAILPSRVTLGEALGTFWFHCGVLAILLAGLGVSGGLPVFVQAFLGLSLGGLLWGGELAEAQLAVLSRDAGHFDAWLAAAEAADPRLAGGPSAPPDTAAPPRLPPAGHRPPAGTAAG